MTGQDEARTLAARTYLAEGAALRKLADSLARLEPCPCPECREFMTRLETAKRGAR